MYNFRIFKYNDEIIKGNELLKTIKIIIIQKDEQKTKKFSQMKNSLVI